MLRNGSVRAERFSVPTLQNAHRRWLQMTTVDRLGHVAIRVQDVSRAVAFYEGLGMRLVWKADDWCYLEAGEGRDGLALLGPGYKLSLIHI